MEVLGPGKKPDIKSAAIVKYTAMASPAPYLELTLNTDLNKPPNTQNDHWNGRLGHWLDPKMNSCFYSSIQMANIFPDCIGEVDVISDAENIKTLLKMPFSKTHVSMMVHRIGKTLLLDEFDIHSHLLRASKKEWEWLKKFFFEKVMEDLNEKEGNLFGKRASRGFLQNKNMFSNFLHYSLAHESQQESRGTDSPGEHLQQAHPFSASASNVVEQEKEGHEFLRTVLWTFEDIRMLIGSDMPIFGGGVHPAVSLRLHDMKKPINILTGLDYWLDNLMCNVPEVLMCYHLNGIVQKYELLKTEDIPQLKNSQFSATLVKDVAQNILSFLKSRATKSGHTYWLFKGKKDDVVKLYDLTALCANDMDNMEQNVFSFPVAMLLYRVAKNMKESPDGRSKILTVHKLLTNCLTLIEKSRHPQIATSAHYLLSDVYVPNTLNPSEVHTVSALESELTDSEFENDDEDDLDSVPEEPVSSFNVKALSLPVLSSTVGETYPDKSGTLGSSWKERCEKSLGHVVEALLCIKQSREDFLKKKEVPKEGIKLANPCQAIPLNYSPLKANPASADCLAQQASKPVELSWQACQEIYLYKKATQLFCLLSEILTYSKQYSSALKCIKIGMLCIEKTQHLSESHSQSQDLLAHLLGLTGDIYFIAIQEKQAINKGDIYDYTELEQALVDLINLVDSEFIWCWEWPKELDARLNLSAQCYEKALDYIPDKNGGDFLRLKKRFGNINNELGVFYMNQALQVFTRCGDSSAPQPCLDQSQLYLDVGTQIFESLGDTLNQALLYSNNGRLLRLQAHILSVQDAKQLSAKEKKLYDASLAFYTKAQTTLGTRDSYTQIWDSLTWEMSTTHYTLACLLQDYAPLEFQAVENIEREIVQQFMKSLKLCEAESGEEYKPLYQFRAANIHHKLASLHQYSCRNHTATDSRKAKQTRQLSEAHYSKSLAILEKLENWKDYLKVTMEHMSLRNFQLLLKTGVGPRQKLLKEIFTTLIAAFETLSNSAENPKAADDLEEREGLYVLYSNQLLEFAESMARLGSVKETQNGWKAVVQQLKAIPPTQREARLQKINQAILALLGATS